MSPTRKRIHHLFQFVLVVLLAFFVISELLSPKTGVQPRSKVTIQLSRLKQLSYLLQAEARNHDGQYPDSYRAVLPPGDPDQSDKFVDPATRAVSDWLYYPGHTTRDGGGTILMASPKTVGDRQDERIVLYCDGTAAIIGEPQFREALQMKPGR